MIVRAGTAVSFLIPLPSGWPDAGVTYNIYDPTGASIGTGVIAVPADAVSVNLRVEPGKNTLAQGALLSYRDVAWTYTVGGQVFNDERRYTVEARLPFGVSADGVRAKLGVDKTDLPDSDISLAKAYISFQGTASADPTAITDPSTIVTIGDAVEALAALILIPTMAVRVAAQQSSGTDKFQRQDVDWSAVQVNLEGLVSAGYLAANPAYDETANFGPLLILVTPAVDAITGA